MTTLARLLSGEVMVAARGLLGRTISSRVDGEVVAATIIEVEAYGGSDDPASHAYRGETPRNRSMFGASGSLFVYRSHGIHWCMNVVTGPDGEPNAVLLRSAFAIDGLETAVRRRGSADHLMDGPGKLAQALGVDREHDGTSVVDGPIRIDGDASDSIVVANHRESASPRR